MKKRILLKDIANELNMSITTVSFVINGKAREKNISEASIQRVLDLVKKLGYQPNTLATSLRTGKTKIIGFLVDDISEPFFSGIARFLDEKASENGYKILFSSSRNSTDKAVELLQIFQDRHVDGYVMALPEGLEEEVRKIIDSEAPVVLFDRYVQDLKTDYVIIDNRAGAYQATDHLIGNGYKNIAFITVDIEQQQMIDRLEGYQEAIANAGLDAHIFKIAYDHTKSGVQEIEKILSTDSKIDAILFGANYICLDGLRAFRNLGLNIHKDIAIVSFDDFELLEFCNPPVTAIAQPLEAIADGIMKIMLSKLNSDHRITSSKQVVLPVKLNVRGSSLKK